MKNIGINWVVLWVFGICLLLEILFYNVRSIWEEKNRLINDYM